jgi:putative Mn2+ efflux pump MntP
MMTQAMFNLVLGTLLRGVIMTLAGWLVARGMLPQGSVEEWVGGAVLVVLGLAWGVYQKYASQVQVMTALQSPAGLTPAELKAKISDGKGASLRD